MAYTTKDAKLIVRGDHEDFDLWEPVAEDDRGSGRWHRHLTRIYKANDGTHWRVSFSKALTEYQEDEFLYSPIRVERREVIVPETTKLVWEKVSE